MDGDEKPGVGINSDEQVPEGCILKCAHCGEPHPAQRMGTINEAWYCDLWCANGLKKLEDDEDLDYDDGEDYRPKDVRCPECGRFGVSEYHMANCQGYDDE